MTEPKSILDELEKLNAFEEFKKKQTEHNSFSEAYDERLFQVASKVYLHCIDRMVLSDTYTAQAKKAVGIAKTFMVEFGNEL